MKLNIGCGTDYRDGFINIDGSNTLPKIDKIIDISSESLLNHFGEGEIEYILANDVIEHHFHWEAVRIMREFYRILIKGGQVEIRVPDAEYIIKSWKFPIDQKLNMLFGGQDKPQGRDAKMDESRKHFPQFFCHKYGWTMKSMDQELRDIGFSNVVCKRVETNFIARAIKWVEHS
jgi:predicted SAM-dependent methyltransferase